MADSDRVDSEEEQDAETSVDNVCYEKIKIAYKRGSGEQDTGTSVDSTCYEKLQSRSLNNVCKSVVVTNQSLHTQRPHQPLLTTSGRCSVWRENRLA